MLQEEQEQLVEAANNGGTQSNDDGVTIDPLKTPQAVKFGWIKGVLVRLIPLSCQRSFHFLSPFDGILRDHSRGK